MLLSTISWVDEVRYLKIFIVRSRYFKCTLDCTKRSFYSAVDGILLLNIASEDVILQLIGSKYMPILLYGLEPRLHCQLRAHKNI